MSGIIGGFFLGWLVVFAFTEEVRAAVGIGTEAVFVALFAIAVVATAGTFVFLLAATVCVAFGFGVTEDGVIVFFAVAAAITAVFGVGVLFLRNDL